VGLRLAQGEPALDDAAADSSVAVHSHHVVIASIFAGLPLVGGAAEVKDSHALGGSSVDFDGVAHGK